MNLFNITRSESADQRKLQLEKQCNLVAWQRLYTSQRSLDKEPKHRLTTRDFPTNSRDLAVSTFRYVHPGQTRKTGAKLPNNPSVVGGEVDQG